MKDNDQNFKCCVFDLPNEIILKIFSYLDELTVSRVQLVCKRWCDLSDDASLWNCLCFKGNRNIVHIPKVLHKHPFIRILRIEKGMLNTSIFKAISLLPRLMELSLTECSFFAGAEAAFRIVLLNTSLKTLVLKNCLIGGHVFKHISEAKGLKSLKISCIEHQYLTIVLDACELLHLEIDKNNCLFEEGVKDILTKRWSTLQSLILNGEKRFSDAAFMPVSECANLSVLSISRSDNLTDETLVRIGKLRAIKHLSLPYGSGFTAVGLKTFFLKNCVARLSHLDLTRCAKLDDDCAIIIASNCRVLRNLYLKHCILLTDKSFLQVVRCCEKLEILDASWISSLHGAFLHLIKEELRNLKVLDLRSCDQINRSLIHSLESSRPPLTVYK